MACIMLVASVGIMVNSHICGGEVRSVALFVKADSCPPCQDSGHHARSNGCCEEKSVVVKSDVASQAVKTLNPGTPDFHLVEVILPVLCLINNFDAAVSTPRFTQYKPPLPERDITIIVHSFLI
jgi:hypothetical protein